MQRILRSPWVVFAREDPEQPFSYSTVKVLKGAKNQPEIHLFVDSTSRRTLAANPQMSAVLIWDETTSKWQNLGVADKSYQQAIRQILLFGPVWQTPDGARHRVEFFIPLFDHPNPILQRMAYQELARSPYSLIKEYAAVLSRDRVDRVMANLQLMEWRSLAILLIAQSGEEKDRRFIEQSIRSAARFSSTTNLGAIATAYIETEEQNALDYLRATYCEDADRTTKEVAQIQKALSLHGTEGHTNLRDQIVACYAGLVEHHPELAAKVVDDLNRWNRHELKTQLAGLQESVLNQMHPLERNAIMQYINSESQDLSIQIDGSRGAD